MKRARNLFWTAALGAAAAGAQTTSAPTTPSVSIPEPSNDVIVTARRHTRQQTLSDTRALITLHEGQIARFETPICPLVVGMPAAYASIVAERIQQVAQSAGLRTGRPGCHPNVTLAVSEDGAVFVRELAKKRPTLFDRMKPYQQERLLSGRGPVWSWSSTDARRRDGGPVDHVSLIDLQNDKPPIPVARNGFMVPNASLSRLSAPTREDTTLAFVVLRADALNGLTLNQIADFAALTALASLDSNRPPTVSNRTIATLFADRQEGREPAAELTTFDRALLKGLYTSASGFSADHQSAAIASLINEKLELP